MSKQPEASDAMKYRITKTKENTSFYPLHSHPHWEVMYYTKGEGELRLGNGAAIPFQVGRVICIPPKLAHGSASALPAAGSFENICVQDPLFPLHRFSGVPDIVGEGGCLVFQDTGSRDMEGLFKLIYRAFADTRYDAETLIGHLLMCVYDLMRQKLPAVSQCDMVETLTAAMVDNLCDPDFHVRDAIARIAYSPNYVRSVFRAQLGMTPSRYLLLLRLKNAKRLLSENAGYSVTEIALLSGFRDPLYFSKAYHKQYGISPTSDRKNAGQRKRKD